MDGQGGFVDLLLAGSEATVGGKGCGDVDVIKVQVGAGVDDKEIAVLEEPVVLVVVEILSRAEYS
jgi:hypothetical protein